jgi:hypothetical protein
LARDSTRFPVSSAAYDFPDSSGEVALNIGQDLVIVAKISGRTVTTTIVPGRQPLTAAPVAAQVAHPPQEVEFKVAYSNREENLQCYQCDWDRTFSSEASAAEISLMWQSSGLSWDKLKPKWRQIATN